MREAAAFRHMQMSHTRTHTRTRGSISQQGAALYLVSGRLAAPSFTHSPSDANAGGTKGNVGESEGKWKHAQRRATPTVLTERAV